MLAFVHHAVEKLQKFRETGTALGIDREQVVAHATLGAFLQHWPEYRNAEWRDLFAATAEIRQQEPDRWLKQRRIALSKLARMWNDEMDGK